MSFVFVDVKFGIVFRGVQGDIEESNKTRDIISIRIIRITIQALKFYCIVRGVESAVYTVLGNTSEMRMIDI